MKSHINGVPIYTLAHAYELLSIGATMTGVAERFGINRDRLRKAVWLAKTKGLG